MYILGLDILEHWIKYLCVWVVHLKVWDNDGDGKGNCEDASKGAEGADKHPEVCFWHLAHTDLLSLNDQQVFKI